MFDGRVQQVTAALGWLMPDNVSGNSNGQMILRTGAYSFSGIVEPVIEAVIVLTVVQCGHWQEWAFAL